MVVHLSTLQEGHLAVVMCLVKEFGAYVNEAINGSTALCIAAQHGRMSVVKCLVKELGADINQASTYDDGTTPLIAASAAKHVEVLLWLIKHGADARAPAPTGGMAVDVSREYSGSA
jgi:ankyrin repeat protein